MKEIKPDSPAIIIEVSISHPGAVPPKTRKVFKARGLLFSGDIQHDVPAMRSTIVELGEKMIKDYFE